MMISEHQLTNLLPPDALAHVLQFVPLEPRLQTCAVVCKAWQAAACVATTEICGTNFSEIKLSQAAANSLTAWLCKYGSTVAYIDISGTSGDSDTSEVYVDLPFPCHRSLQQLHTLRLFSFNLLCSSSSIISNTVSKATAVQGVAGSPATIAPAAALPSLTRLQLDDCFVHTALGFGMSQLATLSSLRHLGLYDGMVLLPEEVTAEEARAHAVALGNTLGQLKQLTALELLCGVDDRFIAGLSQLPQLQVLALGVEVEALLTRAAVSIDLLPGSLVILENNGYWQLTCRHVPSSWQLTALQQLLLDGMEVFEPAMLAHMQQLVEFRIVNCLSLSPPGAAGVRMLLSVLPQLQQLEQLSLLGLLSHELPEAEGSLYTALVSCSSLAFLDLEYNEMPAGAARLLFQPGCPRPVLQRLKLGPDGDIWDNYISDEIETVSEAIKSHGECLPVTVRDVARLASCCPSLQQLGNLVLEAAASSGAQPAAGRETDAAASAAAAADAAAARSTAAASLRQLTALTKLWACGDGMDDSFAEQVLAQLTQLELLEISYAESFSEAGLAHLTQLTRLTGLTVRMCKSIFPGAGSSCGIRLSNEAPSSTDAVWQQLVEKCSTSPTAAPVLLEHRDNQLQQQCLQLHQQGLQLAAAQQEVLSCEHSWQQQSSSKSSKHQPQPHGSSSSSNSSTHQQQQQEQAEAGSSNPWQQLTALSGRLIGLVLNVQTQGWLASLLGARHWLAVKCIGGQWYNLDSYLAAPVSVVKTAADAADGGAGRLREYLKQQLARGWASHRLVFEQQQQQQQQQLVPGLNLNLAYY